MEILEDLTYILLSVLGYRVQKNCFTEDLALQKNKKKL